MPQLISEIHTLFMGYKLFNKEFQCKCFEAVVSIHWIFMRHGEGENLLKVSLSKIRSVAVAFVLMCSLSEMGIRSNWVIF